jgi:hypothetical protein
VPRRDLVSLPADKAAAAPEADGREPRDEGIAELPSVDLAIGANLALEQAAFPDSAATLTPKDVEAAPALAAATTRAGLASGLMLAVRFVQARFLSVWGLLVAAALCPPQVFADFAMFSALANFVSVAALMRLEAVFFLNSDSERLGRAFRLALAAGALFVGVAALFVMTAGAAGWIVLAYGVLFLISLAARAVIRLVSSEATAEGDFAAIGNTNIVQALVQPGMMVLLIWPLGATSLALFAADAIGHVASAGYLLRRRRAALVRLTLPSLWSFQELRSSASRWRTAPSFLLPSALLSFGFMVVPLLALPYTSDHLLAAHVALSMRLLEVPTQMFAAVSVPLVLSSLRTSAPDKRQSWVRLVTLGLMGAATALFAAIAVTAVVVDVVVDGTQWQGLGEVVAVLALFYGGIALVTPLHEIASLSKHPRRQLATNAVALVAVGGVMAWFGPLSYTMLGALGLVSIGRMLAHVHFAWTRFGEDGFAEARR